MNKKLFGVLLCAVTLSACNNEELLEQGSNNKVLKASIENDLVESRAGMESDGSFFWQEGDKIGALMSNGKVLPMTLQEGDGGKSSGTFTINTSMSFGNYAVYPYSTNHTLTSTGELTFNMPASYDYGSVIGEKENSFNIAMWGEMVDGSVSFKHLGGVFKIYVNNLPVGNDMQFVFKTTGKKITGDFTTMLTADEPILQTSDATTDDEVIITFDNTTDNGSGVFYIPAPVGTYPVIDVVLKTSEGEEFAWGYWTNIDVVRRAQKKGTIGEKTITGEGEGEKIVSTAEELQAALNNGGEVTLAADITLSTTLNVNNTVVLNLNGKTLTNAVDNSATDVIVVGSEGNLTINGEGTVEAVTGNDGYAVISDGVLTINGGTYKSGVDADGAANAVIYVRGNGQVYVNGGTFPNDNNSVYVLNKKDADRETTIIEVKGGTFKNFDPANNAAEGAGTNFVAAGYSSVLNNEGYYEVSEGIVNETAFVAALNNGGEVTLAADITLTSPIIVEKDVTVNLGGYDLTGGVFAESNGTISEGTTDSYVFWVKSGTLTINGEGNVTASEAKYSMAVWADGGKVIINGGNYFNSYASDLIYAKGEGAEVLIYGGTFKASNKNADTEDGTAEEYSALNLSDNSGAKITVYGGSFYMFDPANNKSENPAVSFVAAGYSSVLEGDYYVVSQGIKTETALLAAIANGGEVTLAADITLTSPIIVEKDVTVNLGGYDLTGGVFAESNGTISEGTTDSYVFWVKSGTLTINGEGNVTASEAKYSMAVWADGGKVIINGGNYFNSYASDLIYAKGEGAEVLIYGGTFKASNKNADTEDGTAEEYSALNLSDNSGAKITVYGGSFYMFDPANNKSENPAVSFVAEGYKSTENNGWYTVAAE